MTKPSFSGPWMPWYHGDFLRATQGWNFAERGIYFLLLGASWEMGPLPDDRRRLAGIVGAQLDEFDPVWSSSVPKAKAASSRRTPLPPRPVVRYCVVSSGGRERCTGPLSLSALVALEAALGRRRSPAIDRFRALTRKAQKYLKGELRYTGRELRLLLRL
jgi:hypothetical protein